MKTKKPNAIFCPDTRMIAPKIFTKKYLFGSLAAAVLPMGVTGASAAETNSVAAIVPPPAPPSHVHALFAAQISNEYLTPRGMIVHDKGVDFQPLFLGFINLYSGDGFINNFTLVPGVWNDISTAPVSVHAPFGSQPTTPWVEIDPIAGVSLGFAKHFTLDVTYTAFAMQILDIGTSQHLDTKLSFDDSSYLKAFALHPYVEYWQELSGKATAADVPYLVDPLHKNLGMGPGSSFYFELGVAPSYTFDKIGLKVELPCRVLLPDKNFYGTYYSSASTVGLYEVGIKTTMPLKFMPEGYGHWSCDVGYRYQGFVDKNLQDMQAFNAPGRSVDGSSQFYAGLSTFF